MPENHIFRTYDDKDLIEKGCRWCEKDGDLEIVYKRACLFRGDGNSSSEFKKKYFLRNYNDITFRVIYQDGSIYTNWIKL